MLYVPNSESFFLQPLKVTRRVFDEKSKPLSRHVLTQVYIDQYHIPTLKTRKDRKWCCPDQQKPETVLWVYETLLRNERTLWILSLFDWSWALRLTDFVPCCSVGCISWQGNSEENFVNGDQMSKCRLFMDWWAQRQRGKKMNILLFPRHRSFQARLVLKRLKNLSLLSTGLNWSASWLKVLRTMVRVDLDIQTSTTYFNL